MTIIDKIARLNQIAEELIGIAQTMSNDFPCTTPFEEVVPECVVGLIDCDQSNVRIFARDSSGNLGAELQSLDGCDQSFIYVDWVDECGNYLGTNVPAAGSLTILNNLGEIDFDTYLGGLTNRYIYTPTASTNALTANFEYGNNDVNGDLQLCQFSLTVDACDDVKTFPAGISSNTLQEAGELTLPQSGSTLTTAFGTTIQCIAEDVRHSYATRLAINSDNSKLLMNTGQVYDVTVNPSVQVGTSPFSSESVWSMTDASILYGINSANGQFQSWNCDTGVITALGPTSVTSIGSFEGQVSANGIAVLGIGGNGGNPASLQSWNLNTGTLLGTLSVPADYDKASVSIDGSCIIVKETTNNNGTYTGSAVLYSNTFGSAVTVSNDVGHGDFATDCNGNTVFAYFNDSTKKLEYVNKQGVIVTLPYTVSNAGHLSGNNCVRDGMIYGSFIDNSNENGFIGAVELCPNSNYQEAWVALTDNRLISYECQQHPSVSKDATTIVFVNCDDDGNPTTYLASCN